MKVINANEFVKGMIYHRRKEVMELYVDFSLQNKGIGAKLMEIAIRTFDVSDLFVLGKIVTQSV